MATPLKNPLKVSGGTFYQFASAANDIAKTVNDDDARFVFSKFACLNLPDAATPTNNKNDVVWEALGFGTGGGISSVPLPSINADHGINFAQSFQNYVLNFEELALNGNNSLGLEYDSNIDSTISERIFWKWLASINAMRFTNADILTESTEPARYREEYEATTGATQYSRVVQYIGDIDAINTISRKGQKYTEIYAHVPLQHGYTPLVLWKRLEDANYQAGEDFQGSSEYIEGRNAGSVHPRGLDMTAYFDNDSTDEYQVQSTFGSIVNSAHTANSKPVYLSEMDGVILDFDPASYLPIVSNSTITSISEYNTQPEAGNFDFNIVLLYYDVYSVSNPSEKTTNLYGILIVDDYNNTVDGGILKAFKKFVPNNVTKDNGNSWGIKANIKFDTSSDNVGIETIINEYNNFSMDLFIDLMTRMQDTQELYDELLSNHLEVTGNITALTNLVSTVDGISTLNAKFSALEGFVRNAQIAMRDPNSLLDQLVSTNKRIDDLMNGMIGQDFTLSLDIFDNGRGINLDRSTPNKLKIVNTVESYTGIGECLSQNSGLHFDFANGTAFEIDDNQPNYSPNNNRVTKANGSTYYVNDSIPADPLTNDLRINIDDGNDTWKTGQTYRIKFKHVVDFNSKSILLYTDAANVTNNGEFGVAIGSILAADLTTSPIFEVICINASTYEFEIDIIK